MRGRARLRAGLAAGDPTGEVAAAWQAKDLLRVVYCAAGLPDAQAALERFLRCCDGLTIPELSRLAGTARAWHTEILAWHATNGCSNGPTEAVNLLIKKVKRVGHGFRNYANYRPRLLLHCGGTWKTHRTQDREGVPHAWWRRANNGGLPTVCTAGGEAPIAHCTARGTGVPPPDLPAAPDATKLSALQVEGQLDLGLRRRRHVARDHLSPCAVIPT